MLKINDDTKPDPLFLNVWLSERSGITLWLPTIYFDIAEYLYSAPKSSICDLKKRLMTDYKEGKAYSYFDSKFLKEVKYHPISKESPYWICQYIATRPRKSTRHSTQFKWAVLKRQGTYAELTAHVLLGKYPYYSKWTRHDTPYSYHYICIVKNVKSSNNISD